jgi:hypothetical protein
MGKATEADPRTFMPNNSKGMNGPFASNLLLLWSFSPCGRKEHR